VAKCGASRQWAGNTVKTSDFDYYLPQELIAQSPIEPRDASRLMVLARRTGAIEHRAFHEISDYLAAGDVLVCNESRVIPARLFGHKVPTGGKVELLLVTKKGERIWEVLTKGRKVRVGTRIELDRDEGAEGFGMPSATGGLCPPRPKGPVGEVIGQAGGGVRLIEFEAPIEPLLGQLGVVPLPPYIHEPLEEPERYQTIYARVKGSVAAPTAGLHFTPQLMKALEAREVEFVFVTLHIGLDTFRPVRTENIEDHPMHSEYCQLSPEAAKQINQARAEGRRVIAVGTTVVRVLETAVRNSESGVGNGSTVSGATLAEVLKPFVGWTDLFIYPSYQFRAVDALITNFHLPHSTLLMLVAAFAGKELIDKAYREAIQREYRFYSFGDAMLIL
jgi:S-adenosylmethionine:tRNA ribosyltransferase-isomerase